MAIEVVPGVLDEVETGAVVQRHTTTALAGGRAGVCGSTDLAVSQSSTPAMTVRVAAGYALVAGSTTTYQGMYSFHNDAAVDDLAISPGDPTNPRNDIVVAQVRDASYAGSDSDARLFVVEGTPAGAPSDPSLPASCLALARVVVEANESTSIVNGDITDLRTFAGDWATAWGRVGSAAATSDQGSIAGSEANLSGCTATFTAVAGRRYKVTAQAEPRSTAAADVVWLYLRDGIGGTQLKVGKIRLGAIGIGESVSLGWVSTSSMAGAKTFQLSMVRVAGSGTITNGASATDPTFIVVEDIGPL